MAEQASITPSLAGRVWLKNIKYPFLNRAIDVQTWGEISRASRIGLFPVSGRSLPVAQHELAGSRTFTLTIITGDVFDPTVDPLVESRDLDLTLAVGETFFIHVPPTRAVPGGYVAISGTTEEDRYPRAGDNTTWTFVLPCTTVNPPAPDVVGTTLTWGTVLNLYGSWNALLAANSTWADLLANVGSPEDLVTL